MQQHGIRSLLILGLFMTNITQAVEPAAEPVTAPEPLVWKFDRLDRIGGHKTTVVGAPQLLEVDRGKAIVFDGKRDGLFIEVHPLAGAKQFTVELIFRPDADGRPEQRFFHMQENESDDRVMFETRMVGNNEWFLDTFIKSGEQKSTLYAETHHHAIGPWYHAALVVDDHQMRHYVSGKLELSGDFDYQPQRPGRTSVGVRQNKVYWYHGAIREARFTRRALQPKEFTNITATEP